MASILDTAGMVSESRRVPADRTDHRQGLRFFRRLNARDVRVWQLDWPLAPAAVLDELDRDVELNAHAAITWTPPGGSATKVRYSPPSVSTTRTSCCAGSASVRIEELLAYD